MGESERSMYKTSVNNREDVKDLMIAKEGYLKERKKT